MLATSAFIVPFDRVATPAAITIAGGATTTSLAAASIGIVDGASQDLDLVGILLYNGSAPADDTDLTWGGAEGANFPLPPGTDRYLRISELSSIYVANGGTDDATLYVALYMQAK